MVDLRETKKRSECKQLKNVRIQERDIQFLKDLAFPNEAPNTTLSEVLNFIDKIGSENGFDYQELRKFISMYTKNGGKFLNGEVKG